MTKQKITKRTKPVSGPKKELQGLLNQLNDDEIGRLVIQAKIMVYNHKVEEVNLAAKDLADSRTKKLSKTATKGEVVDIVSAGSPKNFNIVMGSTHLFLNLIELKAMVKIAQAADGYEDGVKRLYRWCQKERNDIIIDGKITGPSDSRLLRVFELLRERYTVG